MVGICYLSQEFLYNALQQICQIVVKRFKLCLFRKIRPVLISKLMVADESSFHFSTLGKSFCREVSLIKFLSFVLCQRLDDISLYGILSTLNLDFSRGKFVANSYFFNNIFIRLFILVTFYSNCFCKYLCVVI